MRNRRFQFHYHLMMLPGIVVLCIFSIVPMLGGVIAFQDFNPGLGFFRSEWVGLDNFRYLFELRDSRTIFFNTVFIALMKMAAHLIVPLLFALMLHELRFGRLKRWIQTIVYLPHFLSWVILSGIVIQLLSSEGPINQLIVALGGQSIMFLGDNNWFPYVIVASDTWKEFGFETIIYLAALTGISPDLYEAAEVDGASRMRKLIHVTLPGIATTVVLLATLSLGNILNAGFDQIFNLYNPLVYASGDIIDTYVYRVGLLNIQYGLGTAVGLMKSVVSFLLIVMSYWMASRFANYRVF
ncbi:sugar ABC transporter permease [Cohnella sp. LGH]|uniref:Putative aldouronate transport system permease protein n=1 Tax=Cohnella phaseoli TaxID=456490 RepID=A0A3D9KB56_9BACL|nr:MULTISPECIES: ABC transporter permease subunit [Cohnella]QTH42893.1 sugar ABC transporter permease [Cohnella sp. LGH]RED83355.1 putative aldouronate transport system permease protein [Cohnella phaseoli]